MHVAGRLSETYEEELLLAMDEGLLSGEEAEALREEALRLRRGPLDLLRERGRISEDSVAALRGELSADSTDPGAARPLEAATLTPVTPGVAPPVARSEPDEATFPIPDWDRYQSVRFLGQGGMGRVFLAYDPMLRRNVALKFVRGDDPELARRFLSEARAQARVRHERVCEVYEVGEARGRGYIAMRFVDGQPLGQLARTLTLEQKVLLLRQAAEGVHAAHGAGLIHRDIKPGNILVERTPDGGLAPFVMDFGLARDWREEGAAPNAVQGTPHYMAPEQARGEVSRLDRRADIYALGATLYSLLTGRPPFTGTTEVEVITRLQNEEPVPPRALDADIPSDVEAIVLKCLEKQRPARYDSARALAEDLQRFLDGEPVLARPGLGYRLRRKVRKHRVALTLGSTALTVVLLALVQAAVARGEVAERERLTRRFTERVERIEASARYSALSRLHDTREDRRELRASMDALEAEVREAGPHALGPGQYALGRALLVLDDREAARTRLEAAWAQGYREPRVAWALAQVLGDLYQERLLLDVERRSPEQRELRRKELEQHFRDPALAYLRQAEGPDVPVPPLYVKALFAFYEGRHEEALTQLEAMGRAQPWFYEAPLLQGDVLLARATQRWHQGDKAGSQEDLDAGRRAYATAIATAESQPTGHYVLARLELAAMVMALYGEGDVLPHYERGVEAASHALTAAPDHHRSLVVMARLHRRLAEQRINQGREDAEPLLEKSILAAREALTLAPPSDRVALELAISYRLWARYRQERGQDPAEPLRLSIEAFERLRPEERDYAFHANLGLTYQVWADAEAERGVDPLEHQGKAIDAYLAAISVRENQADAWINLGTALRRRASTPGAADAGGDLTRARDALAKALALNPGNVVACFRGAEISEQLARWRANHGEPHEADLEQALALFRQGLGINAKLPPLHNGLGAALLWQAEQRWEDGGDSEPLLQQAQAAFEEARTLAPKQVYAHNNLGEVWTLRATFQTARRENPVPSGRAAEEAYRQALALQPTDADLWANLGRVQTLLAAWSLDTQGDPKAELVKAEDALTRATTLNPRQGHAWRNTGEVRALKARWLARRGAARDADFELAAQAFQQALALEPRRHDYRLAAARFHFAWAGWRQQRGEDATPLLNEGLARVTEVLADRPGWARAQALRASALLALAETSASAEQRQTWRLEGQEVLRQALARNPHLELEWRGRLPTARDPLAGPPTP
ncbi:hypothetical protein GCM10012319_35550 [Comamonas sp. KCTC 72670]|nr:hypothetical protein GCM10012319_35550 [Comamonas sp. KCTC 72670]